MAIAAGLLLIEPGFWTDLIGLGLLAVVLALQIAGRKADKGAAPAL
jgi:UPF0716 family protein affecting phage T7 exclusion